jgi:signal peptidase II
MSWFYPFYPYGGIGVFKDFLGMSLSINHVENIGAAWGAFSAYSGVLFYLRILIIASLIYYLIHSKFSFKRSIPFSLIIIGAIGNILDSIFYGHVIDMIHFKFGAYSYPLFNVADATITIGVIWFLISSFFCKDKSST